MLQSAPPSRPEDIVAELDRRTLDFRRLLDHLPGGAYLCDPDGLITYDNRRAVALWGRAPALNNPADRFCGSLRLYTVGGDPVRHGQCWMALALGERGACNGQEIVIERPDGSRATALAYANPIHDGQDGFLGAVNVLFDITEWRESEARQRELEGAVSHMARRGLAGAMAAGFAHELNQPLTAIANYGEACIERLRSGSADERRAVVVTAWADATTVTVEMSDTGPGLSPEVRDRLFYPFVSTRPEGMGLRLSISQRIVEAHGGQLWLADDAAAGDGARFRFSLPVAAAR